MALKHHAPQFGRFWIIGTVCMVLYYATLFTMKSVIGFELVVATVVSSAVYGLTSFILHKVFTFRNKDKHKVHHMVVRFLVVVVAIGLANTGLMYLLAERIPLWYGLTQCLVTTSLMIPNYFANQWAFAKKAR